MVPTMPIRWLSQASARTRAHAQEIAQGREHDHGDGHAQKRRPHDLADLLLVKPEVVDQIVGDVLPNHEGKGRRDECDATRRERRRGFIDETPRLR